MEQLREYISEEITEDSSVRKKLGDLLNGIGKADELSNSIAKKDKNELDTAKKIADNHAKLAVSCGFDPIKLLFDNLQTSPKTGSK